MVQSGKMQSEGHVPDPTKIVQLCHDTTLAQSKCQQNVNIVQIASH